MRALLETHALDRALQYIDMATDFIKIFLDRFDKHLDEEDLKKLKNIASLYTEHAEHINSIHDFYEDKIKKKES